MKRSLWWHGCIPLLKGALFQLSTLYSTLFQIKNSHLTDFHFALLNGAVSQLLVELPRTLKGQNGVQYD